MSRTDPSVYVRMPMEIKEGLRALAVLNRRSLNAQIVCVLELALPSDEKSKGVAETGISPRQNHSQTREGKDND